MPLFPQAVPAAVLQQLGERIECCMGLHFPANRLADLERGLVEAARQVGSQDARTYADSLLRRDLSVADVAALAGSLTIGETHFFRDPRAFTFLEKVLLPELIASQRSGERRLRFWSAGCATGEEPYSLAILLHRLLPDLSDWNISILGTDINPKFLARAAAGVYTEWSFRDTPDWVKPRYFIAVGEHRYEIQPWIKRMARFERSNLVEDGCPAVLGSTSAMNLIICRNVLLYFASARTTQVVARFHRALVAGGYLVIGAVEASQMTFPDFAPMPAPSVALYRKLASGAAGPTPPPLPENDAGNRLREPMDTPETAGVPVLPTNPAEAAALGRAGVAVPPRTVPIADDRHGVLQPPPESALPAAAASAGTSALERAQACADLGELGEALVWCERALAADQTDASAHFLYAEVLQGLHRDAEALPALRRVLFLDPRHVLAVFAMAMIERRQGRTAAATRLLANARQSLAGRAEQEELTGSGGLTVGHFSTLLAATLDVWTAADAAGSGGQTHV